MRLLRRFLSSQWLVGLCHCETEQSEVVAISFFAYWLPQIWDCFVVRQSMDSSQWQLPVFCRSHDPAFGVVPRSLLLLFCNFGVLWPRLPCRGILYGVTVVHFGVLWPRHSDASTRLMHSIMHSIEHSKGLLLTPHWRGTPKSCHCETEQSEVVAISSLISQ